MGNYVHENECNEEQRSENAEKEGSSVTTIPETPAPPTEPRSDYLASYYARKDETKDRLQKNRDTILRYLKRIGATKVTIGYSGSGDSGQVDSAEIFRNDTQLRPKRRIRVLTGSSKHVAGEGWIEESKKTITTIEDALMDLTYDWLEAEHSGWENNDGADGTCDVDVSEGQFLLTHRSYYTECETMESEL